jgi:hypothetical protein
VAVTKVYRACTPMLRPYVMRPLPPDEVVAAAEPEDLVPPPPDLIAAAFITKDAIAMTDRSGNAQLRRESLRAMVVRPNQHKDHTGKTMGDPQFKAACGYAIISLTC